MLAVTTPFIFTGGMIAVEDVDAVVVEEEPLMRTAGGMYPVLVKGIAHELNNPINYIAGNVAPLRRYCDFLSLAATELTLRGLPNGAELYLAPARLHRSEGCWEAAVGALADNGLAITSQDRDSGAVSGRRGAIDVVGNVRSQSDGSVRVEFTARGPRRAAPDPR